MKTTTQYCFEFHPHEIYGTRYLSNCKVFTCDIEHAMFFDTEESMAKVVEMSHKLSEGKVVKFKVTYERVNEALKFKDLKVGDKFNFVLANPRHHVFTKVSMEDDFNARTSHGDDASFNLDDKVIKRES